MDEVPLKVTTDQLGIDAGEEHEGHLEYDLGNLMAYDPAPMDLASFGSDREEACHGMATRIFQALTRQLFSLPSEPAPVGRIAELPAPSTVLPREKPIPRPRPPTKWEVFAQRKGIVKRKRSREEWDEGAGEYKRRYGYNKANDAEAVPYIEAGPDEEPGVEDPFTRMAKEKKERVGRQGKQQAANLKRAAKAGGRGALPPTLRLAAALPEHGRGRPARRQELQLELKQASRQAAISTGSMGKFDRMVKGEDPALRKPAGKKRTFLPVAATSAERAQQGKLVDQILRHNADDIVDINRAIGKFEASAREEPQSKMKMKGANKKGRLSGGKKERKPPPPAGGRKAKAAAAGRGRSVGKGTGTGTGMGPGKGRGRGKGKK